MKYYILMRIANNPAGVVTTCCTEEELEERSNEFNPDYTDEISEEEYKEEVERQHRRFLRAATGYPKFRTIG